MNEAQKMIERAKEFDQILPPGPYEHCDASDGKCPCGMIWSVPWDVPILSLDQVNEEHHGAVMDPEVQQTLRDFATESRTLLPALAADLEKALAEIERLSVPHCCAAKIMEIARQRNEANERHAQAKEQLSQAERDKAALCKDLEQLSENEYLDRTTRELIRHRLKTVFAPPESEVTAAPQQTEGEALAQFEAFGKAVCDGVTATIPDAVALKFCMCKPYAPLIVKASAKAGCEIWRSDDDSGPISYSDVACVLNAVAAAEAEILAAHRDTKPENMP